MISPIQILYILGFITGCGFVTFIDWIDWRKKTKALREELKNEKATNKALKEMFAVVTGNYAEEIVKLKGKKKEKMKIEAWRP